MAAPQGNQNAAKAKIVTDAIRKALANDDWKRLRDGAEKVAEAFAEGEQWAVQYVADRIDGKAHQSLDLSGVLDIKKSASDMSDDELIAIANASRSAT